MEHIIINGQKLISIQKIGRTNIYRLSNNSKITSKNFITVETKCPSCSAVRPIKKLHNYNLKKVSECNTCKGLGSKNGFYGKKHTKQTKNKISKQNKNRLTGSKNHMYGTSLLEYWIKKYGKIIANQKYQDYLNKLSHSLSGTKNPFYGKKHTKKTLSIIQNKNQIYRDNLSIEEKEKISKKLSNSQKELYNKDPQDYIKKRRNAGKISATKSEKYKMNSIEKLVEIQLDKLKLNFEYSIILDFKQFDFGSKKYRILIEVQGDYWHGNPSIYTRKQLNDTQRQNIKKDKEKIKFAKKHNMKLYHIWESDIRSNNFTVLEEIKNEICTRTNK